jgi:hypothetical protein
MDNKCAVLDIKADDPWVHNLKEWNWRRKIPSWWDVLFYRFIDILPTSHTDQIYIHKTSAARKYRFLPQWFILSGLNIPSLLRMEHSSLTHFIRLPQSHTLHSHTTKTGLPHSQLIACLSSQASPPLVSTVFEINQSDVHKTVSIMICCNVMKNNVS